MTFGKIVLHRFSSLAGQRHVDRVAAGGVRMASNQEALACQSRVAQSRRQFIKPAGRFELQNGGAAFEFDVQFDRVLTDLEVAAGVPASSAAARRYLLHLQGSRLGAGELSPMISRSALCPWDGRSFG